MVHNSHSNQNDDEMRVCGHDDYDMMMTMRADSETEMGIPNELLHLNFPIFLIIYTVLMFWIGKVVLENVNRWWILN